MTDSSLKKSILGEGLRAISVARNSLLIFSFQFFSKIIGFVSSILIANSFGSEQFGIYNYAFALTTLFTPLCDLGIDMYFMKELPGQNEKEGSKHFGIILVGKSILIVIVIISILIVAALMESFGSEKFIIILFAGIVTILRTFWNTYSSLLRVINKVKTEAQIFTAIRIFEFISILAVIYFKWNILTLLIFLSIVNMAGSILTLLFIKNKYLRPELSMQWDYFKVVARGGLPFALTSIFVGIYFNIDTVLIAKITGDQAAGLYRAAYNLIIPLTMVTATLCSAVFPYISMNYNKRKDSVQKIITESMTYLLMISLPIAVMFSFLSKDIILFLFKPEYEASKTILIIVGWFLPIAYVTNLYGHILGATNQQSFVLKITIVNALFNVIANLILIPKYSYIGASVVTVLTELLGFILLTIKLKPQFSPLFDKVKILKILIACILIIPFLILDIHLHVIIKLIASTIMYGILVTLFKLITFDSIKKIFASSEVTNY
jgi:O-antigen/teichoic acid export membrane protein